MAVQCPRCRRQYDVTLFQFRHGVRCACGARLDLERGHVIEAAAAPPARLILACAAEARAQTPPALTDRGLRQAAALAERFGNEDVGAVYAAPSPACRETAEAAADALGLPVQATALLDGGSSERVGAFLRALARWQPQGSTLVVVEAAVCRDALGGLLGVDAGTEGSVAAPPASVHVVVAEAAGWRAVVVDGTAHLAARERGS